MESARFDRLVRRLAHRPLSRRAALQAGAAGLALTAFPALTAAAQGTPAVSTAAAAAQRAGLAANNSTLFVQTATSGTFGPNPRAAGTPPAAGPGTPPVLQRHGAYLLTLHGHSGETIGFSDRPQRQFGEVPTSRFLQAMGFTPTNPPNAALVVDTPQHAGAVFLLELMTPAYDGATQTLTYEVTLLQQYPNARGGALAPLATTAQQATPAASFGSASLFIDDCPDQDVLCATDVENCNMVEWGDLGQQGYCWNWGDALCEWCRDYDTVCNQTFSKCAGQCGAYLDCGDCTQIHADRSCYP